MRSTVNLTILDEELVVAMVRAYGLVNADVVLRQDVDEDQLIDYLQGNRRYVRAMASVNKIDAVPEEVWRPIVEKVESRDLQVIPISADKDVNLDVLKDAIFDNLDLMRIYMRPRGGETDYEEPLIIRRGATVRNVCDTIHRDIKRKFRYAKVWGESAKFPGQDVGLDHILADHDVITIVQRK